MIFALLNEERVMASIELERVSYKCPHCKGDVIIRKGRIKIPHFAHKTRSNCEHEPESDLHINMKLKVAEILGVDTIEYNLGNVIADVYDASTNTAYEIQCSPLTLAKMEERWAKYELINQVWLFRKEHFGRCYSQFCLWENCRGLYFDKECNLMWIYGCKRYDKYIPVHEEPFESFNGKGKDFITKKCNGCGASISLPVFENWKTVCISCWKKGWR